MPSLPVFSFVTLSSSLHLPVRKLKTIKFKRTGARNAENPKHCAVKTKVPSEIL
jgi:hypothetical protein